jgi:hypothetical protein
VAIAGQGGHFARHAQDVGVPGDVGRDGDIQHGIAHVIHQGHPTGASSSRMITPSCSSEMPSSFSEQIME